MNVVVPDASVILKWALPSCDEPDADRALLLRNAIRDDLVRAVVPSLWLYEVGNTVARRFPAHAGALVVRAREMSRLEDDARLSRGVLRTACSNSLHA